MTVGNDPRTDGPSRFQLARGVWARVSSNAVEIWVPRLFADRPIVLPVQQVAVGRPDEPTDPIEADVSIPPERRLELVPLYIGRGRPNLVLVLAQPGVLPPVRRRARFLPEGSVYRHGHERPHDGYYVHCRDPDRAVSLLTSHGVERTQAPYVWVATRRNWL